MEQLGLLGATTRVLLGTLGFLQNTPRESKIRLKYRKSHSIEERVRHHAERRSRFLGHGWRRWLGRSERREQQLGGLKRRRADISLTASPSLSSKRKSRSLRRWMFMIRRSLVGPLKLWVWAGRGVSRIN